LPGSRRKSGRSLRAQLDDRLGANLEGMLAEYSVLSEETLHVGGDDMVLLRW
jgi:hypothetical protein